MFTRKCALASCCRVTRPCSKTSMSTCRRHRLLFRCRPRSFAHRSKTTRLAQACAEAPHGHSSRYFFADASGRCNKSDVRVRRAGRTSEGLASYQGHFSVDDRAFEYLPSAKVRREKTPPWRQEHKRRHVRSTRLKRSSTQFADAGERVARPT